MNTQRQTAVAISILAFASLGHVAQAASDPGAWQWRAQAGALLQSDSDLDTGGDMAVDRFFVEASGASMLSGDTRLGFSLGYGVDDYDFSGTTGFGGLDPWGMARELRVGATFQHTVNSSWTVYGIPSLRFNTESGASLDDGLTGGLLAGASYRVNDQLSIGPGVGVFSELEDDTSFIPILLIDWQISENLSLETGRGFAASRGPGLQLRWTYSPKLTMALGGRYEKTRFRLDDKGIAPGGVGEDRAVPVFVSADYKLTANSALSVFGGVEVNGSVRLEDSSGRQLSKSDLADAPFFGAALRTRF